jgi:hypothetical protein
MPTEDDQYHAKIPMVFASVDEGIKQLKNRIAASSTVQISNIPVGLLDELLPILKGKDVKIILPYGANPTAEMQEIGDVAIQKARMYYDFGGVEADEGSIYFSDVIFCVTWVEDEILQISTLGYNENIKWFEMIWRYAEKVK